MTHSRPLLYVRLVAVVMAFVALVAEVVVLLLGVLSLGSVTMSVWTGGGSLVAASGSVLVLLGERRRL